MIVGVVDETTSSESRVAASPASVTQLTKLGYKVQVQAGAGSKAYFSDQAYRDAGASIIVDRSALIASSDILIRLLPPSSDDIASLRPGSTWIGFIWPSRHLDLVSSLQAKNVSTIAMDCIPRISRAQKMDALSSMTNIAGYRAIVEAASAYSGFFAGQITAAGKVAPAKVLVIGAGVAGLAAIGAARGLGAIVRAFDTRSAVKEQVQSMGAEFLELDFHEDGDGAGGYAKEMSPAFIAAEMALFAAQTKECDIVVTTAIIPNKPAPKLITVEMVQGMKPGSVIVDMAAEQGGNCELTEPTKMVERHGVKIIGYTDLASRMATRASSMYANNIANLLTLLTPKKDGNIQFDLADDVVRGSLLTHQGALYWPLPKIQVSAQPSSKPTALPPASAPPVAANKGLHYASTLVGSIVVMVLIFLIGAYAPEKLVTHLTVFVLSCFLGWQVVWSVTPALHTPLMSVTNAISGIIVVGAMLQVQSPWYGPATLLAALAVLIAAINISGGFLVTSRMLKMFHKGGS